MALRGSWARISSFSKLLRANADTARSLDDGLGATHGVTIEQYEILRRLALRGYLRQADLSEPPLVTAANVRRELTTLEQGGLIRRSGVGDMADVALTDAGREKVRAAGNPRLDELLG